MTAPGSYQLGAGALAAPQALTHWQGYVFYTSPGGSGHSTSGLLMPNGKPIGTPGSKPVIREVRGSLADAKHFFNRLIAATKATPTSRTTYKGIGYDVPGGGFIGLRTAHTGSPNTAATIDVNLPGIPIGKIKFNP